MFVPIILRKECHVHVWAYFCIPKYICRTWFSYTEAILTQSTILADNGFSLSAIMTNNMLCRVDSLTPDVITLCLDGTTYYVIIQRDHARPIFLDNANSPSRIIRVNTWFLPATNYGSIFRKAMNNKVTTSSESPCCLSPI